MLRQVEKLAVEKFINQFQVRKNIDSYAEVDSTYPFHMLRSHGVDVGIEAA